MITTRLLVLIFIIVALPCAANADPWKVPEKASSDELRLGGIWGAAQARSAKRMAAAPLDSVDFILADLSLKQIPGRRFTSFNAWLTRTLGGVRPVVLWNAALPSRDGCVVVPASLDPNPDPKQPQQWKLLKLSPLRSVAGQSHKTSWFSFHLQKASLEKIRWLITNIQ